MGFLNNTTITVDLILTKRGRELLGSGNNEFQVTKFVTDDEVDYRLWDTSHPNGTNFYGKVIENILHWNPYLMKHKLKYKLISLPKETSRLPILDMVPSLTFQQGGGNGDLISQYIEFN